MLGEPAETIPSEPQPVTGWGQDAMFDLGRLAALGMQLAEAVTAEVLDHNAARERGDVSPLSPSEASKAVLDFTRIARCVRLTHVLKARACGYETGPKSIPAAPAQFVPFHHRRPVESPPLHDLNADEIEDLVQMHGAEIRVGLDHIVTDPNLAPGESERLTEELEAEIDVFMDHERQRLTANDRRRVIYGLVDMSQIARRLGRLTPHDSGTRLITDIESKLSCWAIAPPGADFHSINYGPDEVSPFTRHMAKWLGRPAPPG